MATAVGGFLGVDPDDHGQHRQQCSTPRVDVTPYQLDNSAPSAAGTCGKERATYVPDRVPRIGLSRARAVMGGRGQNLR